MLVPCGIGDYVRHTGSGEMGRVAFQTGDSCCVRIEYSPSPEESGPIKPGTVRIWRWDEVERCEYKEDQKEREDQTE